MKQEIRLPKGYELKELEKGVYEIVKSEFKLENGKDYIRVDGDFLIINRKGERDNSGFDNEGDYYKTGLHCATPNVWREATNEEVFGFFEKHLVERYGEDWRNVKIKDAIYGHNDQINNGEKNFDINKYNGTWWVWNNNGCLFHKGKWAEVLEEKKVATDLSDIDRPYHIDAFGIVYKTDFFQTKNHMTSKELYEGILALQQLIAFRDDFHKVHGGVYGNNHGSIRFDGNEFMACKIFHKSVEVAIFDFDTYDQAKEFYETHKDLFEELKKLYWKDSLHKIKHV